MRNIKLIIEYDGGRYDGWVKSSTGKSSKEGSISDRITDVLTEMEQARPELIGAIRTEAGVHALRQVASFKTESTKSCTAIKQYLNRYLPRDIAVLDVTDVPERFHAAFNAKGFIFEYRLTAGQAPSVFDRKYNHYCFRKPDKVLMQKAAGLMIGKHDLKAFSDNPRMKKSTVRTISSIDIYEGGNEIQITFTGDDFWPNMVRLMTAAIVSVGVGETDVTTLENAVKNGAREGLPDAIEPRGLFLSDVIYDE